MLEYIKNESNKTYTENGAVTNVSTLSDCLDLFACIGALRYQSDEEVIRKFVRGFTENKDMAMKILFFARDVREGLGERHVFRTIISWLAEDEPQSVKRNIGFVAEYGRWDDLLCLMDTECRDDALACIKAQLDADIKAAVSGGSVSLLAKWLPSVNASNPDTIREAKRLARLLGMKDAEYRKTLSWLRGKIKILENNLREKDYTFSYDKQPSAAMLKYHSAFIRNDEERYMGFLESVRAGRVKMNTGTLAPYQLVAPFLRFSNWTEETPTFMKSDLSAAELSALNTTWGALPDYCGDRNCLAIVDTSGSMFWESAPMPADVAMSLGLYFAERNKGMFHDHFITFSEKPQLISIKGETFADKLRYICSFCEIGDTNIEAVFDLILKAAVAHHADQSDLPEQLVIISDMEFNWCAVDAEKSNFDHAKETFAAQGYRLPQLVFWNVSSRNRQQPVTMNEEGVILISGCTPKIFEMVSAGAVSPYEFMLDTINSKRYAKIAA